MKSHSSLVCLILAFIHFIFPFSSFGQDNNTNGDNIDVNYVRFDMFIDPALSSTNVMVLNGAVTYYFTTKVANVQKIKFDFYRDNTTTPLRLIGDSIRYHGVKYDLTPAKHSNDTLIVDLPAPIPAIGTLESVTIYYHGNPPQSSGSRGYKRTTISTSSPTGIISTHSSGFFARQWWPCKHNMTDKIDSVEFFITAPAAYTAVANGLLLNGPTPPTVGTNKTWHWKSRYPVAHYLIAIAVHPYVRYDSPAANINGTAVPIINYLTPGTTSPGTNTATIRGNCDHMKPVMEYFSTLFGDYPFKNEKYGHVVYTFSGGMENQTASYIGTGSMTNRNLLAHELAHQWWGDKVTCLKWNNIWVNEGFARYSEYLYLEQFGTAGADVTLRSSKKTNAQSASETVYRYDVEVVNDATDHTGKIFVSPMVYDKASIVISMLRKLVGDVKFFQALKNYLNDPLISYGYSTTEDVRRHFEAVSGKNLIAFFDDFINKSGYPTYNVQWVYSSTAKKVGIKLNQTKTTSGTHAVTGRYHTVLPIRLLGPTLDTVIVAYDDGVASLNLLQYNVSSAITSIQVDPYSESYSITILQP
jgi:aminopeptidase N